MQLDMGLDMDERDESELYGLDIELEAEYGLEPMELDEYGLDEYGLLSAELYGLDADIDEQGLLLEYGLDIELEYGLDMELEYGLDMELYGLDELYAELAAGELKRG